MPTTETYPASGVTVEASAQVLLRRHLIIRNNIDDFGPNAGTQGVAVRQQTYLPVQNLEKIFIHLFLFPTMEEGGVIYPARNNIEWRPVFRMPQDTFAPEIGTATDQFLPFVAPAILPVGSPISFVACCNGVESIAIEIRAPLPGGILQARERLIVSMSASH